MNHNTDTAEYLERIDARDAAAAADAAAISAIVAASAGASELRAALVARFGRGETWVE